VTSLERVAIFHPGEMGSALGRLLAHRGVEIVCSVEERSKQTQQRAREAGFILANNFAAAVHGSDLVISLVPPSDAVALARRFAATLEGWAGRRPIYLDANSVSPMTAQEVGRIVSAAGARCVDGSLHGRAQYLGMRDRCILFLSGDDARWLASALDDVVDARVCGEHVGAASSLKMSLGAFSKGLVALFVEIVSAWGTVNAPSEFVGALAGFYPETVETLARLVPSYPQHATRRLQEIEEVGRWFGELGNVSLMAQATHGILERLAHGFPERETGLSFEGVITALLARGVCREDGAATSQ